jgi:hypothetical protein
MPAFTVWIFFCKDDLRSCLGIYRRATFVIGLD